MRKKFILYEFTQRTVKRQYFRPFLSVFEPQRLPYGPELRPYMGSLVIHLEGSERHPCPWQGFLEAGDFWRLLHRVWPFGLFFCDLGQMDLKLMTLGCLKSFSYVLAQDRPNCAVGYDQKELARFLRQDWVHLRQMAEFAEMSDRSVKLRFAAIRKYFEQPFPPVPVRGGSYG